MDYLTRYPYGGGVQPSEILPSRFDRAPLDHDVLVTGIREGVPTPQDLVVVAQTLVSTGSQRAGGRKTAVVEVEEPGFFCNRTRVAARVTSELEVWVRGRR